MLQIENGEITGFTITGNGAAYDTLMPLMHDSGVPWWVLDPSGEIFVDTDGTPYHIKRRTHAEIETMIFPGAQTTALGVWNTQVNQFISQYFDTGTQISFLKIYIQIEAARPLITQVDAWVTQVMAYYYTIKAQIQAATTIAELEALQASMEFGALFGVQGSLLAVPDVHLAQFF